MANRPFVLRSNKVSLSLSGSGLLAKTYSNLFYESDYVATGFRRLPSARMDMPSNAVRAGAIPKVHLREEEIKKPLCI